MSKTVIINDHKLVQKGRKKKRSGSHLMKCLLTELRPSGQENIQPSITTYGLPALVILVSYSFST